MSGKKTKSGKANSNKKQELVQDERLQAIVLTDSFETRFMPLTSVRPRCLLPLANIPLIEYTLEFLAKAGVNEVYLICASHGDQIQEYIDQSKWSLPWAPFKISTIMSLESRSVGDAMRDLDNRGLITGDFVLVSGDLVTNMDFEKALDIHKQRRKNDKDHIVTMCLSKATQFHKTRSHEPATFIFDKSNDRCIYYQDIPLASSKEKTTIDIDPELLEGVDEFVLRNDLIDCHVDICSPHVPAIFQENFDYQYLRRDFVKGVLSSDLLKKHIYGYITDEYATRAESWQTYDAISQDFIARWCYPLVLNSNLLEGQTYSYESQHIYKEKDVVLSQSCKIKKNTAIGSGSKIGEGTVIENSVIGRNCMIGSNIQIKNSYIWDNVTINDNSNIVHSLVASGVKVGSNVTLNDGCIIGFDVIIDNDVTVPVGTKIAATSVQRDSSFFLDADHSLDSSDNDEDEEDSNSSSSSDLGNRSTQTPRAKISKEIVGPNGKGVLYESDDDDEDEDGSTEKGVSNTLTYKNDEIYFSDTSISSTTQKHRKRRTMSMTSVYTDFEGEEDEEEDFEKEAIATVERAIENNHDLDTSMLELNTLRMSMNVTYHEVRNTSVIAILRRIFHFVATQTLGPKEAVTKVLQQWGPMFKRQAFDNEEFRDLMNIFLNRVLDQKFEKPDFILFHLYNTLYDMDIIDEDIIYKWWDVVSADDKYATVIALLGKWIDWLKTADEESSEEEDSDDSE